MNASPAETPPAARRPLMPLDDALARLLAQGPARGGRGFSGGSVHANTSET